jgi:Holliday junction resolvase RusA-like endonuclease
MTQCKLDDIDLQAVRFSVPGKIHGKDRPRFTRVGKYVRTYTPEETLNYEKKIQREYIQANRHKSNKALRMRLCIYREHPKSMSAFKKMLANIKKLFPTVKPDVDNVLKVVLDALNNLAYEDDNQVVQFVIIKTYGVKEGLHITLEEIGLREQAKITKEGIINEY